MDIGLIEMLLISSMSVVIYGWFFRIKWWKLVFGIPPFLMALVLEDLSLSYFSLLMIAIIIAPIIEETAKFLFTFYGKDVKTDIDEMSNISMRPISIQVDTHSVFKYFLSISKCESGQGQAFLPISQDADRRTHSSRSVPEDARDVFCQYSGRNDKRYCKQVQ